MRVTVEPAMISLFGHASISARGAAKESTLAKPTIALLAYVVVFRNETLRRDRVAYALWPDEPEAEARANLRRHLYLLGRVLADSLIVDTRTIRWNPSANAVVDVISFETSIGDPDTRAEALESYRGDLVVDAEAEWLEAPRARLREQFCLGAYDEARTALVAGDFKGACLLAERILAADPWREDAVRIVMEGRAAADDRAGALAYYNDFTLRLRAEIDAAPMVQTRELAERFARAPDAPRTLLTSPLSRFIGRSQEISSVEAMLGETRMVTLTGPGGVGKSRLAAEVVARYASSGEVVVVRLASASDDRRSIAGAILEAFNVGASDEDAVDVVSRIVGSRKLLLYVDNADRVIVSAGELIGALLRRTAGLRVLVSSQQRLRLEGERVFALRPLSVPSIAADLGEIERSEAVQLFFDRARAIDAGFTLDPKFATAIASICRRVDGMPLSLELAAARTNVLTVSEIDERLSDRFDFLRSKDVGVLAHHRTLRATLDWSFELLSERERTVFRAFAVFPNGWTLAAADALVGDALDDLSELIDKSLVLVRATKHARRFAYLESIRLYAREHLDAVRGEREILERRAFAFYGDFVAARTKRFSSPSEKAAFDEITADHDNILALLDGAIGRGDVALAATLACDLTPFWLVRGFAMPARDRLERLVTRDEALPAETRIRLRTAASLTHFRLGGIVRAASLANEALALATDSGRSDSVADALLCRARCSFTDEDVRETKSDLERALALYERGGDRVGEARTLDFLGMVDDALGEVVRASARFDRSLSIYESLGDLQGIATVKYHLGFAALMRGASDIAVELNEKAKDVWHECGNLQGEILAQYNLACAEMALGRRDRAWTLHLDCVRIAHRHGFRREFGNGLDRLAEFLSDADPELATRCLSYAAGDRTRHGHVVLPSDRATRDRCLERVRQLLCPNAFDAQWHLGRHAREDELIASLPAAIDAGN